MKVAQMLATIPDALPQGICRSELAQLQANAPAMGWPFVQAPHGGRARAGLAEALRELRAQAAARGLARPGASRDRARRRAARLQAAISRHGSRRSRPTSASSASSSRSTSATTARSRTDGDPCRDRRAPARGARLRARGPPHGALRPDAARRAQRPCAGGRAEAVDRAAADHDLARRRAAAAASSPTHRGAGDAQPGRAQHVPRLVRAVLLLRRDPRRPASRQLHGAAGRLGQSAGFRLHARLPAALRRGRRSISTTRC